jgi:GGDEF domain-containing protein
MLPGPPRRRPARPVADASLDVLLDGCEDLAKGWLLALVEQAPLDEAARVLATDLRDEGPRLCQAIVRAITSDADQQRLKPGGALFALAGRAGELAGAGGPEGSAQAVDALHDVLWAGLRRELRDPDPDLVAQLAERLAQVMGLVRTATLQQGTADAPRGPGLAAVPPVAQDPRQSGAPGAPPAGPAALGDPPLAPIAPEASPPASVSPPGPAASAPAPLAPSEPGLRGWMDPGAAGVEPPPLWVSALGEEIARAGSRPLSLLLAELEDADRVSAVESEAGSVATFSAFAKGVRQAVRRQDILVCESATRAWVIARETGRAGAHSLADRISSAVREGPAWRGAPMLATVGIAVLGEDGTNPAELIDAAEEDRFAASAQGGV